MKIPEHLDGLSKRDLIRYILELESRIEQQDKRIAELEKHLLAYENAHTPPSQQRHYPKREKNGKGKLGAPVGHKGVTREQPEPTETKELKLDVCPYCNNLLGGPVRVEHKIVEEVPVEFRGSCFNGLGGSVGDHFGSDVSFDVSVCNEVPFEFRGSCFDGLGQFFGQFFGGDVGSGVSACNMIPVEFRSNCFTSLSWNIGHASRVSSCTNFQHPYDFICFLSFGEIKSSDFFEGTDECSSIIDEDYKSWCYRGFGRALITHYSDKVLSALSVCNSLSNENYKFNCSKGISEGVGNLILSNQNVSFVLGECNKLGGFNSYCYERIGKQAVSLYNYDFSKVFEICNETGMSFRNSCFTGVGKGLGEQLLYNLSLASIKCDKLPSHYNTDCKQGIEEVTNFYNVSFIEP